MSKLVLALPICAWGRGTKQVPTWVFRLQPYHKALACAAAQQVSQLGVGPAAGHTGIIVAAPVVHVPAIQQRQEGCIGCVAQAAGAGGPGQATGGVGDPRVPFTPHADKPLHLMTVLQQGMPQLRCGCRLASHFREGSSTAQGAVCVSACQRLPPQPARMLTMFRSNGWQTEISAGSS